MNEWIEVEDESSCIFEDYYYYSIYKENIILFSFLLINSGI